MKTKQRNSKNIKQILLALLFLFAIAVTASCGGGGGGGGGNGGGGAPSGGGGGGSTPINELYVSNGNSITVYSRTADGNIAPVRTITGAATNLNSPVGIAVLW